MLTIKIWTFGPQHGGLVVETLGLEVTHGGVLKSETLLVLIVVFG